MPEYEGEVNDIQVVGAAAIISRALYRLLTPGNTGRIRRLAIGPHRTCELLVSAAGQEECLPDLHPHQRCRQLYGRLPLPRRRALASRAQAPEGPDGDPDWESDFFILRNTLCGAALTENLFHGNSDDSLFLKSDEGRRAIVALHVEGIVNYALKR